MVNEKRTVERDLVDRLIDRGLRVSSVTDWVLMLPDEVTLLIPHDSDKLERRVGGQLGYFRTHVYRGREVVGMPMTKPLAILSDPAGYAASLYLNLATGAIGDSPAAVGLKPAT